MKVILQGIIDAYNIGKGWGFIKKADGTSIFFHISNSDGFKAERGLLVEFELAPGFKLGQPEQAVRLRKVEADDAQDVQKGGQAVQS